VSAPTTGTTHTDSTQSRNDWTEVVKLCVRILLAFWIVTAAAAFFVRPDYEGSRPTDYTLSQYLAANGVDLEKGLPLYFDSVPRDNTDIEFANSTRSKINLVLHVGPRGYLVSVPRRLAKMQTGPTSSIKMSLLWPVAIGPRLDGREEPPSHQSYKLVPAKRPAPLLDALELRTPPRNRVVRVPIMDTPAGQHIKRVGVGSFFQESEQLDAIQAVFITLNERDFQKYEDEILK
jgi:hypothetical protein